MINNEIYNIIITKLVINYNTSNNKDLSAPARNTEVATRELNVIEQVVMAVFELIKAAIQNFFKAFEAEMIGAEKIFIGVNPTLPLMETVNRGKDADKTAYDLFQITPRVLSDHEKTTLLAYNIDPSQIKLQPLQDNGVGVCAGATKYFLGLTLDGAPFKTVKNTFEGGVPVEAVVKHEIYVQTGKLLESSETLALPPLTTDAKEDINPGHNLPKNDLLLLQLSNLAVDKVVMDSEISNQRNFTSFEEEADYIVAQIPHLEPGAYAIDIPVYNRFGSITGRHAIGFVKKNNNTFFYDANFGAACVSNDKAQEIVKNELRYYTGYSSTTSEKIANLWHGKANMPIGSWINTDIVKVKRPVAAQAA